MDSYVAGLLVGLISGFVGSIAGGGGLISVPLMVFFGLDAKFALATNKLGGIGLSIGALFKYHKEGKINYSVQKYFIPMSIVAGFIGSSLLVTANLEFVRIFTSFAIIILAPIIALNRNFGIKNSQTTRLKKIIGFFIYFLLLTFGSFFGPGTGPFIFITLMYFFGFTIIEAVASGFIPWLFSSLASIIVFANAGIINYEFGITLTIGMFIGGYFGARFSVLKGNKVVKIIMVVVSIASAIRILIG